MKNPMEAVIESVLIEPEKIPPIIVSFQNGELKDEEAEKMSCGVFYDAKTEKTVLALSNGQIVYKGYRPDTSKELMRTMYVFHNKRTGKIRMVEVERWQVSPVLQKPTADETSNAADVHVTLNKQFGSKKVKRRTEQYERMQVNVEAVKDQLEQTVSNVEIDRLDLSTQLMDAECASNADLPKCNKEATSPMDVYDIYDIVPKTKLETLFDKVSDALKDNTEGKSKFFRTTLKYLKSDPENIKKVAILLYIEGVATWLNMPMKDAKKRGVEICSYSEEINSYIIDTYSAASAHGRLRPNSMKDKAVIHCMILALYVSNFMLDLELFSTVLKNKVSLKKLKALARIILATPSKEDKNVINLKLPLPTPLAMVKKGKKK